MQEKWFATVMTQVCKQWLTKNVMYFSFDVKFPISLTKHFKWGNSIQVEIHTAFFVFIPQKYRSSYIPNCLHIKLEINCCGKNEKKKNRLANFMSCINNPSI